jgi:peptide/nickel transport system ATP-binding protein
VLGLVSPAEGRVTFDGTEVTHLPAGSRGALASEIQVVFQDPYSTLNPSRTVGQSLLEPIAAAGTVSADTPQRITDLLSRVGLSGDVRDRYPRQFSGGQRQRIAIARALAISPRLIVCDEPVSALDVSTQAQVLNLLDELRREMGLSYLFIGHNLSVVRHVCQDLVVLFDGQVMETGPSDLVTETPRHPYTQALVAAAPVANVARQRERRELRRSLLRASPTPEATGTGCAFAARCPHAESVCLIRRPGLTRITSVPIEVACHMFEPGSGHSEAEVAIHH